MASTTVQITYKREGLLMKLYIGEELLTTVDLKKEMKLSDEEAASFLQQLEEDSTVDEG
jgi:hypothetical protein